MKLCVFFIFQLLPWIAWVGDWALRWTEGNAAIQITFVMLIFPLIMNALQYWIIDGFIKDPGSGDHQPLPTDDESDDESGDEAWLRQRRRRLDESDEENSEDEAEVDAKRKERIAERGPLKEANPTPIPSRRSEYDPVADGAGSSGSGHFGNEDDDKEALNSSRR
jgi:STIMATE family